MPYARWVCENNVGYSCTGETESTLLYAAEPDAPPCAHQNEAVLWTVMMFMCGIPGILGLFEEEELAASGAASASRLFFVCARGTILVPGGAGARFLPLLGLRLLASSRCRLPDLDLSSGSSPSPPAFKSLLGLAAYLGAAVSSPGTDDWLFALGVWLFALGV